MYNGQFLLFIARRKPKSLKAPAGRHVYHASASSSESKTYFGCIEQCHRIAPTERDMYNGRLFPVSPQRGDMCIMFRRASSESNTYFGCIEQCHRPSFAPTERDMYNGRVFPVFSPSGATCL